MTVRTSQGGVNGIGVEREVGDDNSRQRRESAKQDTLTHREGEDWGRIGVDKVGEVDARIYAADETNKRIFGWNCNRD